MRLIDADELIEHVWRDKLDSRELIAEMIEDAPIVKEIPTKIPLDVFEQLLSMHLNETSVLDKIRSEIADIYCGQYCENTMTAFEMKEQVLDIIDKYGEEVGKKYKHSCCYWENNECILGRDYCPDDYRCDSFD